MMFWHEKEKSTSDLRKCVSRCKIKHLWHTVLSLQVGFKESYINQIIMTIIAIDKKENASNFYIKFVKWFIW